MQPGVVPGAVYEFHAARARLGIGAGLNDPLTTQAFDTSGNGNHGTLTGFSGTPWTGAGTAADLHWLAFGGAQHVALSNLAVAGGFTFSYEAWCSTEAGAAARAVIAEQRNVAAAVRAILGVDASNRAYAQVGNDTFVIKTVTNSAAMGTSVLRHLVATGDGSTLTLYCDGASVGTPEALSGTLTTLDRTTVGARIYLNTPQLLWTGRIACARIYPFALSAEQIAANRAAGPYWPAPLHLLRPVYIPKGVVNLGR